jgi:RNA polymerase sigma factor (sigma-70 family)
MTSEEFERLLSWLSPDREEAGEIYERIRRKLIGFFVNRACRVAEDLTDDTITRAAKKVAENKVEIGAENFLRFCYGVARNVHREYLRNEDKLSRIRPEDLLSYRHENYEREMDCLDQCMGQLTPRNQTLFRQYIGHEGQEKIPARQELASQMGIGMNALRIRIFRIQNTLRECMKNCVSNTDKE